MPVSTLKPALFTAGPWMAFELAAADLPALQRFFDHNPEYFLSVNGLPPAPDEAQHEFDDLPPPSMAFSKRWMLGFADASGTWAGMASVCADFIAESVWHLGLFVVASRLHGSGTSMQLYQALEDWMRRQGATWLRLGVVRGNARAERFWQKTGFTAVRERGPVEMGARLHMLSVMVKPLAGAPLDEALDDYFPLVARDRPGAP